MIRNPDVLMATLRRSTRCVAYGATIMAVCLINLPEELTAQDRASYPPLDAVLRIEPPRLRIGEELNAGPALFGSIVGVAMDSLHNVYVLDGTDHSVRAFSSTGRHLGSAGRPGRGPGDIADPFRLWHDGATTLYVIDDRDGISVFDTRDGKPTYSDRFGADLKPKAMCAMGGQLIVGANQGEHILHVLSPEHKVVRSFGDLFRRDANKWIQAQYNREGMVMTCDEERGRIFVAESNQETIRAYDPSGRLLWQGVLPGYSGYRVLVGVFDKERSPRDA
jgi:hypothetical protein